MILATTSLEVNEIRKSILRVALRHDHDSDREHQVWLFESPCFTGLSHKSSHRTTGSEV
jgi:hypothetical protein